MRAFLILAGLAGLTGALSVRRELHPVACPHCQACWPRGRAGEQLTVERHASRCAHAPVDWAAFERQFGFYVHATAAV